MEKKREPLRCRSVAEDDSMSWREVAGLNEIIDVGCYVVQLKHGAGNDELPLPVCNKEHYITATLIVTECGTDDTLQKNRMIGQTLIMPDCDDGRTRIFNRTLEAANRNSTWNGWNNIAQTGMDDEITSTEELVASVIELMAETKNIKTELASEIDRSQETEAAISKDAILSGSLNVNPDVDSVTLAYRNMDGTETPEVVIPIATSNATGVMSAADKMRLNMASENDVAIYRPGLIWEDGTIDRNNDYTDGTYIFRHKVFKGLVITGNLKLGGRYAGSSTWNNISILKDNGSLSRVLKFSELNENGVVIADGEKYMCISMPCDIGSYINMYVSGNNTKGIRIALDDEEKLKRIELDTIVSYGSSIFAQSISPEISVIPESCVQKSALDTAIIKGAYIQVDGTIEHGDNNGDIVVLKPGADTQYMHVKGRTGGSVCTFIGYSTRDDGSGIIPYRVNYGSYKSVDVDIYIRPTLYYVYVYIGKSTFKFESIDGFVDSVISVGEAETLIGNVEVVAENIGERLDSKLDRITGGNLFDKDSPLIIKGALLGSTGGVYTADYTTKFCVTHYIRVEAGKSYIANYSSGDSELRLCVVDESKANLLLVINKANGPEYKFTAPEGSAYVRMAIPISNIDSFIFNEGTEVIQDAYYEDKPVYHSEFNPTISNPWSGKTIAMYGDSITELCGNTSVGATSWAGYLIDRLSAKGIVRGWGGTPLIHSGWDNSTPGGNRYWFNSVGEKVAVGTEGGIEINVAGMCDWKRIITQFPTIIKDTIDAVILMGGTNDFRYHEIGDTEYIVRDTLPESTTKIDVDWFNSEYYSGGDFDVTKVQGAVCSAILKLQTWMPNAVIIVATQLSGYWPEPGINGTHQLVSDKSGLTEEQFAEKIADAAKYMSTPVIDINGLTGINQWNRKDYITDNVHPYTDNGKKAMARVFIAGFKTIEPKF